MRRYRRSAGVCANRCHFFFKQRTACELSECDWSSDVCSSDLVLIFLALAWKIIKSEQVRAGTEFLTKNMTIFFVDRKCVVKGKSVFACVDLGCLRSLPLKLNYN